MADGMYVIEYTLHGAVRSFVIRHPKMTNEDAWHWASCDAGVGVIPRFSGERNVKKVSRLTAERHGIEVVRWRPSA
ncbi:DUF6555 family protein [Pseudomonas fulva]